MSPQDKKGVEASDDPLRASDNPLSLSHPLLFLSPWGQLELSAPSQGPKMLPGLCQFPSWLLAAGAAAGARSCRVSGWQHRGRRSCRSRTCRMLVASSVQFRPPCRDTRAVAAPEPRTESSPCARGALLQREEHGKVGLSRADYTGKTRSTFPLLLHRSVLK